MEQRVILLVEVTHKEDVAWFGGRALRTMPNKRAKEFFKAVYKPKARDYLVAARKS